jgi:hypothetical protein
MERPIYAYEYVEAPFDDITELLADASAVVLQSATDAAATHAGEVVSRLRVPLGGLEIGRDIRVEIGEFKPVEATRVKVPLRWRAASAAALFPSVEADLEVQALSLSPPYVQVSLVGMYKPPLGIVGAAGDAIAGHKVAEVAIRRLVADIAARLEQEIAARTTGRETADV